MSDDNYQLPIEGRPLEAVPLLDDTYELRVSPGPLIDADSRKRCDYFIDHGRKVVWIDPMSRPDAAGVARAWQEAHEGLSKGRAWPLIKSAMQSTDRHLIDALADELEDAAAAAECRPDYLLALALYVAANAEPEDLGPIRADFEVWAQRARAEVAEGERLARAAEPRKLLAEPRESLPPAELEGLSHDLLEAEWRLLAPPGWPLPKDLPPGVKLTARTKNLTEPADGVPPHIESADGARYYCPECGKGYRSSVNLYYRHQVPVHGWGRDAGNHPVPPALAVPDPREAPEAVAARRAALAKLSGDGRGLLRCPHCPRSYRYTRCLAGHVRGEHGDAMLADALVSDEGLELARAVRRAA